MHHCCVYEDLDPALDPVGGADRPVAAVHLATLRVPVRSAGIRPAPEGD